MIGLLLTALNRMAGCRSPSPINSSKLHLKTRFVNGSLSCPLLYPLLYPELRFTLIPTHRIPRPPPRSQHP